MIALIMAGGIGTRFWPLSTPQNPKQFLNILGENSMIQETVNRILPIIDYKDIYIVTNIEQKELVQEHLPKLPEENIIAEPYGRNTAPCIGLSAFLLSQKYGDDETMLVLAADHYIGKENLFREIVQFSSKFVQQNKNLLTFGIEPTYPATGYGYIEFGNKINKESFTVFEVKKFKEKPDLKTAKKFIKAGHFAWNSGMFMWRLDSIVKAIQKHMPRLYKNLKEINRYWNKDFDKVSEIYENLQKVPVDIGIMEKADNAAVIPVDIDWNDIGSWEALDEMKQNRDRHNNFLDGKILTIDAKNNYILSTDKKKPIALIGVEDSIVVETNSGLLVCKKNRSQDVKKIVQELKKEN
ncbi:MAG: mannose-1-phosphate guanylyltransferase [Candidatus Cloacimonetes bacterium]|nr:mannose-1-phosphate guanylyltransferase [Candidatus Cloacimonadota bacterium]